MSPKGWLTRRLVVASVLAALSIGVPLACKGKNTTGPTPVASGSPGAPGNGGTGASPTPVPLPSAVNAIVDAIFKSSPEPGPDGVIRGTSPFTVSFNMCGSSDPEGDELFFTYDWNGDGRDDESGTSGSYCRRDHTFQNVETPAAVSANASSATDIRFDVRYCVVDRDRNTGAELHPRNCKSVVVEVKPETSGVSPCGYALSIQGPLPSATWPASGGRGTASVTSAANCSWQIAGVPGWASFRPTAGSGNGTVTISVSSNSGSERQATVQLLDGAGRRQDQSVMTQLALVINAR